MERVARIELASSAWKAEVLPLNYTRLQFPTQLLLLFWHSDCYSRQSRPIPLRHFLPSLSIMVEGGGFEPPKLTRQIYSLIPLATRVPLPKRGAESCLREPLMSNSILVKSGAATKSRTRDLLITNQLLYQLSYSGIATNTFSGVPGACIFDPT
jgi:hypothetical protein